MTGYDMFSIGRNWCTTLAILAGTTTCVQGQAVKELAGHKEPVAAVAYSPDGKTLATGSFDKTIKLWDTTTLKEIKTLEGHTDLVLTLAFSKDGRRLISGGQDKFVKVWSVGVPKELRALAAAPAAIRQLAVSPDGKLLLQTADDGILRLFEAGTGKLVKEFKGHTGPVNASGFAANGAQIYSAGADRFVRIWDVASGNSIATLEVGSQPATAAAVLSNGQGLFVGTATGQVKRFNLPVPPIRTLAGHAAEITRVVAHPNGTQLVSVGNDKTVRLHDLASGNQVRAITGPAPIADIAVSAAQPLVATAGADKAVRAYSLADGNPVSVREGLAGPATAVAFAPDLKSVLVGLQDGSVLSLVYPLQPDWVVQAVAGHAAPLVAVQIAADDSMLVTASADKTVRLWDQTGKPIRQQTHPAAIRFVALAPGKQFTAAVGDNNELVVWDANGAEKKRLKNVAGPLAFSPDGKLFAAAGLDQKVYVQSSEFDSLATATATHAAAVRAMVFDPSGKLLYSAGNDKAIRVSDIAAGKETAVLTGHQGAISSLAITADGKRLISGGDDKAVLVWDAATGKPAATLAGAAGEVSAVAVSADGKTILAASADNNLRFYTDNALVYTLPHPRAAALAVSKSGLIATATADPNLRLITPGAAPKLIAKHGAKVNRLSFSADGKLSLSAGDDNQVRVSDIASAKEVRALAHGGPVTSLVVSADGTRVATASADKNARIWNLADGKPLATIAATNVVNDVALSRDAQRIAFSSTDNLTRILTVAGVELQSLTVPGVSGVQFAADNVTVITGSADKLLRATPISVAWTQQHQGAVTSVAVVPNGAALLTASADNTVAVRDVNNGNPARAIGSAGPSSLAIAGDNARVAVGGNDKVLRLFDLNNGNALQQYPPSAAPITAVAIAPDGSKIVSTDINGGASLWTTPANNVPGALLHTFTSPGPASACAFLTDNKTLAAAASDKIVRFYESPPPPVINLAGHNAQVYGVSISHDGNFAASGAADNNIIVWDLAGNKAQKTLSGHKAQVYTVTFSPDGKQLASGSGDKTLIVWDITGGKAVQTLQGSEDAIYQVVFTADGKQLLSGGVDKKLRLWDVSSAKLIKTLDGQPDEIYGIALSPDGKRLATSGYAGNLVIWDLAGGKPVHQQKLNFGAFDVSFDPTGTRVAVANNDTKTYIVELPK